MTHRIVTLCGSMRFFPMMLVEAGRLTAEGHVVHLPVPSDGLPSTLASVHYRKIDASDEVMVVNPRGYVGESTLREITYAEQRGVPITYMQDSSR